MTLRTQALPTDSSIAGTLARQLLRLVGPGRQAADGSLAAADALAYGATLAGSRQTLLDTAAEAFPYLATDLLTEWESLLGLPTDDTLPETERRARLTAHTRALLGASPDAIESAVATYAGTCTVREITADEAWYGEPGVAEWLTYARRAVFRFVVIVPDAFIESARKRGTIVGIVSRMKPAHTTFTIANKFGMLVETSGYLVERSAIGA